MSAPRYAFPARILHWPMAEALCRDAGRCGGRGAGEPLGDRRQVDPLRALQRDVAGAGGCSPQGADRGSFPALRRLRPGAALECGGDAGAGRDMGARRACGARGCGQRRRRHLARCPGYRPPCRLAVEIVGDRERCYRRDRPWCSPGFRRRRRTPQAGIGLARQLAAAVIGPAQAKLRPAASGDIVDTPRLVAQSNVIGE